MNTRKKRIPSIILTFCLVAVLMVIQAPQAFAAGEPVEVSTFEEFKTAIFFAEADDVIVINGQIEVPVNYGLGWDGKHLTLQRGNQEGCFSFVAGTAEENPTINNFTFDGNGISEGGPFLTVEHDISLTNCTFTNCASSMGGAVFAKNCTVSFSNCMFSDNSGICGSHVSIGANCTASFKDCTLSGGTALLYGGAIFVQVDAICTVDSCTITGNTAQMGGGIGSYGNTTIANTLIYENTATISGSGADVFSDDPGTVSLSDSTETLTSLFHSADMTFGGWCHDNTTEGTVETPVTLTGLQYLTLTATITPEPAPTPDDDDDTPAVTPSQPTHSGSNGSGSTSEVTATKPTEAKHSLSCGKAVLDTTKTAYLLGYADGLMGNDDLVTRGQAAQVIYRLLTEDSLKALHTVTNAFPDVSDTAWYNEAVSTIAAAGVIVGGSDGNFHPDTNITWAEMTTIFTRFTDPCSDRSIITRHWAKDALNTAISYEWIDYKDTFEPDAAVTRAEFIGFINTVIAWATEAA